MVTRRLFLGLVAGGLGLPRQLLAGETGARGALFIGARAAADGAFRLAAFRGDGQRVFDLPLPDRGHASARQPCHPRVVHFARRPGRFALVVDLAAGAIVTTIHAPDGRHFYGHGVFSPDGRYLYATENDYDAARGVIGVYDAGDGYRRRGELASHGVGPHQIRLLADGRTLVVANGGIATHPDLPRVKLNLPDMAPSLAYVDRQSGALREQVRLADALHQLSIRHIAVGYGDTVAVAMQYQGPSRDRVPLVATHRRGGPLAPIDMPGRLLNTMRQYCGSTAFDRGGHVFAVSAPRGGVTAFWDLASRKLLSTVEVADGCGVAAAARPGEFLVSSGRGGVVAVSARRGERRALVSDFLAGGRWDNHLLGVSG